MENSISNEENNLFRSEVNARICAAMHGLYDLMLDCGRDNLSIGIKKDGKCYCFSVSDDVLDLDETGCSDVFMTAKELGWTR